MKTLILPLFFCAAVCAQDLAVVVHTPGDTGPGTALSSSYQFSDTPVGGATSIVLDFTNASASSVAIAAIVIGNDPNALAASPNFSVTGITVGKVLGAGSAAASEEVTVNFTPQAMGAISGYLRVTYQIQQNGCNFTSQTPSTQCASRTASVSTLTGNGTAAQFGLNYMSLSGPATLQPDSASPLNFGNVSTSLSSNFIFTLTNNTGSALPAPAVSLLTQTFGSSAFVLDRSALPSVIAGGASGSFTVTFAPGQTGQANATLLVGSASYPITGTGTVVTGIDALQVSFVDNTGVRTKPQAATPIDFGQTVAGANVPAILKFTVTNPATSFDPFSLASLVVSGTGFALSNGPSLPDSIAPGQSVTFNVIFSAAATGKYTGTLAIGARQFTLMGSSITSVLPDASFHLDLQPLTSQHQVNLSIQLASASTISAIGQLSMTFSPSAAGITDDPAVVFLATSGRQLQVAVAPGAQTATYNGQSALTFQTGTTAGTLTFTVTFPNKAPISQSFTIAPAEVAISKGTAVRQSPNLVVTLTGYDNTYTAGKLAFTFYDTSGAPLNANPITTDASSAFHQYFFTESKVGGAFSVQVTFPVAGTITQVGSVAVSVSNSSGTSTTTESFQ